MNAPYNPPVQKPAAEDAYQFRHALMRDAAYELQLPSARATLHATALDVLEALHGSSAEVVALELLDHATSAGDLEREQQYLHPAAEHARAGFQPTAAIKLYRRIAEHSLTPAAQRGEALADASMVAYLAGSFAQARQLADQALASGVEGAARSNALVTLGYIESMAGNFDPAINHMRESVQAAEVAGDAKVICRAKGNLARLLRRSGQTEAGNALLREVHETACKLADPEIECVALSNLSGAVDDPLQRIELLQRALKIAREASLRRQQGIFQNDLGVDLIRAGRREEATAALREALRISQEVGNRRVEAHAWGNLASVLEGDERKELRERALALALEVGDIGFAGVVLSNLGSDALEQGRHEVALQFTRKARELHTQTRHIPGLAYAWELEAQALTALGQDAEPAWAAGIRVCQENGRPDLAAKLERRGATA